MKRISGKVLASTMPALSPLSPGEETEEVRIASASSSPSRRFRSLPRPGSRGFGKIGSGFGHGSGNDVVDEDPHCVVINGVRSNSTSQHTSPWTSRAVSPISTPASSVVHAGGYFDQEHAPQRSPPEKKRVSWLGSMPASHFTPHRAQGASEASSSASPPPPVGPRTGGSGCRKDRRSSASSASSSSASSPAASPNGSSDAAAAVATKVESGPSLALAPNAQFLALMLLMILIISSPLIKVLSVLLFVAIVVLDDA